MVKRGLNEKEPYRRLAEINRAITTSLNFDEVLDLIVENAAHHIEEGMNPREATIQAMREVTGPVIGITLVLMAVFLPTAFLGGITGQLYRQFALTIAITALIRSRGNCSYGTVSRFST